MTDQKNPLELDRRHFLGGIALAAGAASLLRPAATALAANAAPWPAAPLKDVAGKTAYVTGASSGIGLGIARALHAAGMKVIIGYIDDTQVEEALSFFADKSRIHAIKHDVTDRPGWITLADEAEKKFGRVHLLVNNAGVGLRPMVSDATYNDYDWGFNVNVAGVFNGIHTFVPRMKAYGEGAHICTTSSMNGMFPGGKVGIYTATKFAAVGLMEALRVELDGTNIGTSVYLPGAVNTNIRLSERYRPPSLANAPNAAPNAAPPAPPPPRPAAAGGATPPPPAGMDPLEAGQCVLEGIRNNDLFIFSHPEFKQGMQERFDAILASVPVGREVPAARLVVERVTMRVPLYAAETAKLQANPRR